MATVGDRIRKRRLEKGWTQEDLGRKAHLSKGFLSDVENGKRKVSAANLLDIALVLGLTLDYLMKGDDGEDVSPEHIIIPATLAQFAEHQGLSMSKTLVLLRMQRQMKANRTGGAEASHFDWARFYESLKDFIDENS